VAIPTRIDGAPNRARTLGRRPIVLARLPHAGASNDRVDLELVDAQETDFLEPDVDILANHFVDPGHLENESELATLFESELEQPAQHSRSRRRKKRTSGSQKSRPITTFRQQSPASESSTLLFTLHTQLAPFAGAIVALALIASAGLLYWMIVSPNGVTTEFRDAGQVGFEASMPELPSFASRTERATPSDIMTASEPAVFNLPEWEAEKVVTEEPVEPLEENPAKALLEQELVVSLETPAPEPTTGPATEPTPLSEPTHVDVVEQAASPVVELHFAKTNSPMALDFTKLGVTAEVATQTDSPQSKPVAKVAARSAPQLLNPTK
jgi:hypothetical protein